MSTVSIPRRRDAEENRAGILAAAVGVLASDPAASVDAIAREAGLSRRALYGHFEDRDAIVAAVIAAGAEKFNGIAETVQDDDPRAALAHLAAALWAQARHVHAAAALALNEKLVAQTAEAILPLRRRLIEICERGAELGVLRQDLPPHLTARLVEEAARGVITHVDSQEADATRLATRAALSAAGLSWREVDTLVREYDATESADRAESASTTSTTETTGTKVRA
jgi:AcrR family transcriptional regulator